MREIECDENEARFVAIINLIIILQCTSIDLISLNKELQVQLLDSNT